MIELVHLCLTSMAFAAVWFVQFVHYPLYTQVGPAHFEAYHRGHLVRARLTLAPVFLFEGVSVAWLVWTEGSVLAWVGAVSFAMGMLLTATAIEACYRILSQGFDERAHKRLLQLNFLRGVIWTVRLGIAAVLLRASMG